MSDEPAVDLNGLREMLLREGYNPTRITSQALVDEMWTRSPGLVGLTFRDGTYLIGDLSRSLAADEDCKGGGSRR